MRNSRKCLELRLPALALALLVAGTASAQEAAPTLPSAEEAAPAAAGAPPAASAIPKPATTAEQPAKPKPAKKTAKKAASCDGLFEAACKENETCAWQAALPPAEGAAPTPGTCVKVDKTAIKGTKETCPSMFEALCRETKGCDWTAGAAAADGKAGPGSCSFVGKAKKAAATKPAAAPPAPDTFADQQ